MTTVKHGRLLEILTECITEHNFTGPIKDHFLQFLSLLFEGSDEDFDKLEAIIQDAMIRFGSEQLKKEECTCDDLSLRRFGGCTCGAIQYCDCEDCGDDDE